MLARLVACACLLLVGCTTAADPSQFTQLQFSGNEFQIETMNTPAERATGLMNRTELAADHGMLFIFESSQPVAFWMKNTLIPLDILYFNAEKELIEIYADTPPCTADPCPSYPSQHAVKYVLELSAGTATKIGAKLREKFELSN